ncbi:ABC-three component system middle component 2 [Curtobacterium sp. AB7]|uniref:ABC-three component system middle component 2 n=1 Tax=Curtobacterium sp. AB7 TaxID=3349327 RepID=UPI0038338160
MTPARSARPESAFVPESSATFRMGRLLLLLGVARQDGRTIDSVDRLAYYEFFADNPWVILGDGAPSDANDRDSLRLAGFSQTQLSYASTGHRFASRRERIRGDLAQLITFGLVRLAGTRFSTTEGGDQLVANMQSSYADAYRSSASIVLRRLVRLSNKRLEENVEEWLGHSWLLVDLLDDVRGADLSPASEKGL